jgi:hypothetical protein
MTSSTTYVIPFKSRGRLFVEIPEHVERAGRILAGELLQLDLLGDNIVYHRTAGVPRPQQGQEGCASNLTGKRHRSTSAVGYEGVYSKY